MEKEIGKTWSIARRRHLPQYLGKPCKKHGDNVRFTASRTCVTCRREAHANRKLKDLPKANILSALWLIPSNSAVGRP